MGKLDKALDVVSAIKEGNTILNLGAGKISEDLTLMASKSFLVNVDQSYGCERLLNSYIVEIEENQNSYDGEETKIYNVGGSIFDFLGTYKYKFDTIFMSRIAEHMFYDAGEVGQLLSMSRSVLEKNGRMFILVPNHEILANKLLNFDLNGKATLTAYEALLLNTEFCNTRCDPHGSVWTPKTAEYYIETEGNLSITAIHESVKWDGRDYMLIVVSKRGDD